MCSTTGTASGPKRRSNASIRAYQATPSPRRLTTRRLAHSQRLRPARRFSRSTTAPSQRAMRSSGYANGFIVVPTAGDLEHRALEFADDPGPVEPLGNGARAYAKAADALTVVREADGQPRERLRVVERREQPVHAVLHVLGRRRVVVSNHREPARQRFHGDVAVSFGRAREYEDVAGGEMRAEILAGAHAGEHERR